MKKLILPLLVAAIATAALTARAQNHETWTVGSWNIGHYSLGKSHKTTIPYADYGKMKAEYQYFFNQADVDILALVEYSQMFVEGVGTTARQAILSGYGTARIGPENGHYNCNAIFSNGYTVGTAKAINYRKCVQKRYLLEVPFYVNGDTILVVSTHLDWDEGDSGKVYREYQMEELVERYGKERYVIICGDWNIDTYGSAGYSIMRNAGFTLINGGSRGTYNTWPADAPRFALDNIIVRGFGVIGVNIYNRPDLSDHSLLKATLYRKAAPASVTHRTDLSRRLTLSGFRLSIDGPFTHTEVYDADGRLVYAGHESNIQLPGSGLYIVRLDGNVCKVCC